MIKNALISVNDAETSNGLDRETVLDVHSVEDEFLGQLMHWPQYKLWAIRYVNGKWKRLPPFPLQLSDVMAQFCMGYSKP